MRIIPILRDKFSGFGRYSACYRIVLLCWAISLPWGIATADQDRGTVYLPIVFASPSTGIGASYTMLYFSRHPLDTGTTGTNTLRVTGLYTQEEQRMAALGTTWFLGNGYWKLTNSATTQSFPRDYYGIGNATAEQQQEEYTYQKHSNRLSLLRWMGNHWYLGGTWESTQTEITEYQPDGLIARYYSEHGLEMDQNIHGVGIRISRDTADSPFFPRHGSRTSLSALIYPEEYGADHSFERYSASHRLYLPLGKNGALAFEVQGEQTTSHAPLPLLPRLGGGSTLRGYSGGRYIDKLYLSAQTEARLPIYGRWQGALFTAAGDVFPGFDQVSSDELKYGYGAGIRYALQKDMRINLRLDIAYGIASGEAADGEEPGVYFNFTEAF